MTLSRMLVVVLVLLFHLADLADSFPAPTRLRLAKRSGTNDEIIDLVRDILRAKVSRICNEEHNAYEYKEITENNKSPEQLDLVLPQAAAELVAPKNEEIRILKVKAKAPEEIAIIETSQAAEEASTNDIDISRFDASVMNLNDFINRFKSKFKSRSQMPFRIG